MRPRKRVVVLTGDLGRGKDLRFLLSLRGYETPLFIEFDPLGALQREAHVLLVAAPVPGLTSARLTALRRLWPEMRVLMLSSSRAPRGWPCVDRCLPVGFQTPAEVLEAVKILAARKRGPKKAVPIGTGWQEATLPVPR